MNHELFLVLLLAHILGDFYFQSDASCADKRSRTWKSPYLYLHPTIIGLLSFAAVCQVSFLPWMLVLILSHILIDGVKAGRQDNLMAFLLDQALHLVILVAVSSMCTNQIDWIREIHLNVNAISVPVFMTALLLCLKPANLLVKYVLEKYVLIKPMYEKNEISAQEELQEEAVKVGALIGSLERSLFLIFVVMGQYGAVGFILAAKSIIRYREGSTSKTEYVLAGTLLSLGIAVVCGIAVRIFSPIFL